MLIGGADALKIKDNKSDDELINQLKSQLTPKNKFILKHILLPLCRNAVGFREQSKFFMIWMYNKYGSALRLLGLKMVSEGLIPDQNTIFYLTIDEIEKLFKVRDPLILSKARLRKRLHPKMDKYKFVEFVKGPKITPRNVRMIFNYI